MHPVVFQRALIVCCLFLTAFSHASLEDLNQLLLKARQATPAMDLAQGKLQEAEAKLDEVNSGLYPKLKADSSIAPIPGVDLNESTLVYTNRNDDWNVFFRIRGEIRQGITSFGRMSAYKDAAIAGTEAAQVAKILALGELDLQVRKFYFLYLTSSQNLNILNGYLEHLNEQLEKRRKKTAPTASEKDLTLQLESIEAQLNMLRSRAAAGKNTTAFALSTLTGLTEKEIDQLDPDLDVENTLDGVTFEALREALDQENGEVLLAKRMSQAQKHLVTAKHREMYPLLGFLAFAEQRITPNRTEARNPYLNDNFNGPIFGAGLGLTWDFDFFRLRAQKSDAAAKAIHGDAEYRMLLMKKTIELKNTYEDWKASQSAFKFADRDYKKAKRLTVVRKMGNTLGNVQIKDLVDAMKKQSEARKAWTEAVYSVNLKAAELARLTSAKRIYPPDALKNLE